jgi:hypothetical protein
MSTKENPKKNKIKKTILISSLALTLGAASAGLASADTGNQNGNNNNHSGYQQDHNGSHQNSGDHNNNRNNGQDFRDNRNDNQDHRYRNDQDWKTTSVTGRVISYDSDSLLLISKGRTYTVNIESADIVGNNHSLQDGSIVTVHGTKYGNSIDADSIFVIR